MLSTPPTKQHKKNSRKNMHKNISASVIEPRSRKLKTIYLDKKSKVVTEISMFDSKLKSDIYSSTFSGSPSDCSPVRRRLRSERKFPQRSASHLDPVARLKKYTRP